MTAIVQDRYGSAEVLELQEIPRPDIGDHDVLVRVVAAGVDRGVWHLMNGRPYLTRLAFGLRRPRNPVPGLDVAGVVDRSYPLTEAADAIAHLESGRTRGKIAIQIDTREPR